MKRYRILLFRFGLVSGVVATFFTVACWTLPFPLKADGSGGYYDQNTLAFVVAPIAAVATTAFACFGTGWPRLGLAAGGAVLFLLAYGGLLSNGV